MVAQENTPLAVGRYFGSTLKNFDDWLSIFQLYRHEHPWHQREMKGHVKFVALAEIGADIGGPLVRLRQQHPAGKRFVEATPIFAHDLVSFRQILAGCPVTLD